MAMIAAMMLTAVPYPAQAATRRVALVIGISHYQNKAVPSLTNPQADAAAVAKTLRDDGFDVTELTQPKDLDRATLWAAISAFRRSTQGAEAAVIYYAGHGVETGGRNWLLPADAHADTPDEIEGSAIPTSQLVAAVGGASMVRLVVLDACRDNPFATEQGWSSGTRSIGTTRGLARETGLPPNVVVLLATQPGQKANDGGGGKNSPFAQALSVALATPGLRISSLPTIVSRQMRSLSGIDQRPDQQGIFDEPDWTFRAGAAGTIPAPGPQYIPPPMYVVAAPSGQKPGDTFLVNSDGSLVVSAKGYGLVLQSRPDGRPGLLVSEVTNGSPFDGTVQVNDVILKINSATPSGPQSVIDALAHDRRASISLQRQGEGVATSTELALPKETDE